MFDVGVYKDNKLLMSQQQISIGHQTVFKTKPILHFGAIRPDKAIPPTFGSSEIAGLSDSMESFDMSRYRKGLKVILKENPDGKHIFTGEKM